MTIPPHHHVDARTVGRAGITATTTDLTAVRLVGGWITRRMFHYPVSVLSVSACHYPVSVHYPARETTCRMFVTVERESTHWVMTSDRLSQ